ncbi:MAG: YCF48-related protein [Planctomycetaceae bacterium]
MCLTLGLPALATALAAEPRATLTNTAGPHTPTPLEDDAALYDVQFVGGKLGWAVGDHGVIWHTRDGGKTWSLQSSGVTCPLRSICFLTDRVGWIAGGGTMPYTRHLYGVLLHTIDGGKTWQPLLAGVPGIRDQGPGTGKKEIAGAPKDPQNRDARGNRDKGQGTSKHGPANVAHESANPEVAPDPKSEIQDPQSSTRPALPRLTRVKFFSPDEGIVVGEGREGERSGVFVTPDGGASWLSVPGEISPGWRAADFINSHAGVLAGPRGRVALAADGRVSAPRVKNLGSGSLNALVLQPNRSGWLAGDGGLLLRTETAGLVWQAVAGGLPDATRDVFDFHALCARGPCVWVAGDPGSVVWHSEDSGATWQRQATGQTAPVAAIRFATDTHGCAVGALGTILRTEDAGQTWQAVRGGGRRVALLLLYGQNRQVSLAPVAEQSGELGFRSLVSVVASDDPATPAQSGQDLEARLCEATSLAHGSGAKVSWRLPIGIPDLDRDDQKLIAEWNRRTENRLEEVLTGGLVRQLRTWRPSVLVLEQPDEHDALTQLINEAALRAVEQAADATSFLAQHELAGLTPWSVAKVYLHLPPGSTGHTHVDPHRYLPRVQQSVRMVAGSAEELLFDRAAIPPGREAYRLIRSQWDDKFGASTAGGFFTGLAITAGSDARRPLPPIRDDQELERRQKLADRQKNFSAWADRMLGDSRQAGQLIAQLSELNQGFLAAQAAMQLTELAERYQSVGQWELAELTLLKLADDFPDEPAALKAMQQLVQYWASGEINWRRLRPRATEQSRVASDPARASDAIAGAHARLQQQAEELERTIFDDDPSPEIELAQATAPQTRSTSQTIRKDFERQTRVWQAQAVQMAQRLDRRAPTLAAGPEVQFPLATVYRERATHARADEIYRRFAGRESVGAWAAPAEIEFWLARPISPHTGPMLKCLPTPDRPHLDGKLTEGCWHEAAELHLSDPARDALDTAKPLVMLCYDAKHLYLAGSLPRVPGVRTDRPATERSYDQDLNDFDRVTMYLDIDRDRVTWFRFAIDQRGCTNDSCWHDASWNPRWFVAVDADEKRWSFEAAIPFEELGPLPPNRTTAWGLGLVRTIPAVGWEGWTQPCSGAPRPETFGLLRFD